MFPTAMFESPTQRKILRVLAEKNRRYTVEELAGLCHRSQPTISRSLAHAHRYPFLERGAESGSKRQLFGLDSRSEYSSAIREFFAVERRRERRDGTVPVGVWNLLEDVADRFDGELDAMVELFLFGSYARGDYHTGSDVDLLLVVSRDGQASSEQAHTVLRGMDPETEIELFTEEVPLETVESDEELLGAVRRRGPVDDTEPLIPLVGEVEG